MIWNSQLHMFGAMFSPIIRNTWLYLQHLVTFTTVAASLCSGWVGTVSSTCFGQFSPIIRNTWLYLQHLIIFTTVSASWCREWVGTVSPTCFGRCFRPSSGALDCIYSIWLYSPLSLPAGVVDELEQSAPHVLGDVFAHHQEHLTIYIIWKHSSLSLPACVVDELEQSAPHVWAMFSPIIRSTWLFTASDNIHHCRCQLVSWMSWNSQLHMFGRCFRPSSGALDCIYSIW